ncbi:hypothetical protein [Embleya sp. NPDC059259]|uniref:hypothetical protein n=1 Tax=unclassified Embleya TaxID=2699296 RepID=UPI0036ABEA2C
MRHRDTIHRDELDPCPLCGAAMLITVRTFDMSFGQRKKVQRKACAARCYEHDQARYNEAIKDHRSRTYEQ